MPDDTDTDDDEPPMPPMMAAFMGRLTKGIRAEREAGERAKEARRTQIDTVRQRFRMALTAVLDDPLSPLTESEFAKAISAVADIIEAMTDSLEPLNHTSALVLRTLIEHCEVMLKIAENDAPCACPLCVIKRAAEAAGGEVEEA